MKIRLNLGIIAIYMIMVLLIITGCSASTDVPQPQNQLSDESITIEGVTISDTQITVHGKSSLPDESCVNTELLAEDAPLAWWPGNTCVDVKQGKWELNVPMNGKTLQTGTKYVIRAYQQGNQNTAATFVFDMSGPPLPPE